MWCLYVCILVFCTNFAYGIFEKELSALTQNFFDNLYSDPFLEKYDFSEATEQFIDEKVENYVNLIKEKYGAKRSLKRRSISNANGVKGEYVVESANILSIIEKDHYQDVVFFNEKEEWYATSLKKSDQNVTLGLHKYNGTFFSLTSEIPTESARKIYATSNNRGSFVITAEERNAKIYLLQDGKLSDIQTLQISDISDVYLWENSHGFLMGIATNAPNIKKTSSYVYKWLGRHFDKVDQFDTLGATSMIAFTIGNSEFLAVANSEDDNGQFEINSHIYKYNLHNEKYEIHQKIASNGALDIKFSSFFYNGVKENFLIVINSKTNIEDETAFAVPILYKFIDNYFIPFESLAIREPTNAVVISPPSDGMLLGISSLSDGLSMYSYDGWIFDEIDVLFDDGDLELGIVSLKFYTIKDMPVLVVFNKAHVQFYELKFKVKEQRAASEEANIISWCEGALLEEQLQKKKVIQLATPGEVKENYQHGAGMSGKSDKTEDIVGDTLDYTDNDLEDLQNIDADLDEKIKRLEEMEKDLEKILAEKLNNNTNTFTDLYADEIIVNNNVDFDNLKTDSINKIEMINLLEGKVVLHEDSMLENLTFENVEINKIPKSLNGNKVENLLHTTDDIVTDKLVVHGDVIVKHDTNIAGTLNGVHISRTNILLKKDPQMFEKDFFLNEVKVANVTADLINSKTLYSEKVTISKLDNLRVTNLMVDHINNVKIPVLNEFALKISGDQEISATYEIETLNVDDVNINGLISGKNIGDLINISKGNYSMNKIRFLNDVEMDKLTIVTKLDDIKVIKGKLDVLRSNQSEMQYITGAKTFENINSSNPIQFHGPIDNEVLQKSNPVIMIDGELNVKNDYTIENATVEELLEGLDIKLQFGKHSLGDIQKKGLLLSDEVIEVPMTFTQEIDLENTNADIINGLNTSSLIINGKDEIQNITGSIIINSNLSITGNTEIRKINDVTLEDFEETVLNVDHDQTLTGNYHIDKLSVDIVTSNSSRVGDHFWNNTIQNDGDEVINGTTTFNTIKINKLNTNNIIINNINGINLADVLNNAAKDGVELLKGRKSFETLTVENLRTKEIYDLEKIPNSIASAQVQYDIIEDLSLPKTLNVENVNVKGRINDMDAGQFEKGWLQASDDKEFLKEAFFDNVTIIGNCTIESMKINDLSLRDLLENTVKVDEDFEFDEVEFDNFVFSQGQIKLNGDIEGLDLDSAVTQGNELIKLKTFNGEIIVDGSLTFNGLINGLNYTELCHFAMDSGDSLYKLHVNGSATFAKGPKVTNINGRSVQEMIDNLWFKDQQAVLTGQPDFGEVEFLEEVHVEGLVSGVPLDNLAKNYFSKSKNQTISDDHNFAGGVHFSEGVSAASLVSEGTICGLDTEKFMRTAILDGPQQTFETTVLADIVEIDDLEGVYLVNNMNLDKDVLRYDVNNRVTARKSISNLVAQTLVVNRNYLVQDVDLLQWIQEGVRKNGGASITGQCIFDDEVQFSNGLGVPGNVNGMGFDNQTILLKNVLQEITGNFSFNVGDGKHVYFKNMQLAGRLNGVDINVLLKGQIYDTDRTKLSSPVRLNNTVTADNIEIQKFYNGVNVTELLHNMTVYTFENYYNNYVNLLNITQHIQDSLSDPPKYLDHYKQLSYRSEQSMSFVDVLKGNYGDLAVFYLEINGICYLTYLDWDETELLFEPEEITQISCETTHVSAVTIGNTSFIYIETEDADEGCLYNYQGKYEVQKFPFSKTTGAHSFTITETGQDCVIFSSVGDYTNIYCMLPDDTELTFFQQLHTPISKVNTIESSITYLITGAKHDKHDSYITVWEYNINQAQFIQLQIIHVTSFSSMSTINYKDTHYLAISSDHLKGTKYPGEIQIRQFKPSINKFIPHQTIDVESPINVKFAVLPSEELVLYAETKGVMESFVVYIYEGIFGFREKVSAKISGHTFNPVTINGGNHLVIVHDGYVKVLQATFKSLP